MSGTREQGWLAGVSYGSGTASATVKSNPGRVFGVQAHYTTSPCSIVLKDGGASGTIRWQQDFQAITAGDGVASVDLHGLSFKTDIYVTMSGHSQVSVTFS